MSDDRAERAAAAIRQHLEAWVADRRRIAAAHAALEAQLGQVDRFMQQVMAKALPLCDPAERLRIYGEFYWRGVPAQKLVEAFGAKSVNQLRPPPLGLGISCRQCGEELLARSHTEASRLRQWAERGLVAQCDSCREAESAAFFATLRQQQAAAGDPAARLAELLAMPYQLYLQTDEWRATRTGALQRAGFACQSCGAAGVPLDVHHLTYENRGQERPEDLAALCRPCHAAVHGLPAPEG